MHPDGLPDLFVDRSLGRIQVPRLLRAAGLRLVTLAEHYGVPEDEGVSDVTWLEEVARQGWVALMKDERIRRRPAEKEALMVHAVRAFCLSAGSVPAAEMAERFVRNLDAMTAACRQEGPWLYAVHQGRIQQLDLS